VLDIGERHGVDVEDDLASGNLLEQAVIAGRGIRECGRFADPAADQLDGCGAVGRLRGVVLGDLVG
jgi:hypothetical protein